MRSKPIDFVKIMEVSPRDGLQNESAIVPTDIKLQFIHKLIEAGLSHIETTSFVSPKWVPQMADHVELMRQLNSPLNPPPRAARDPLYKGGDPNINFTVLVPNLTGLNTAIPLGIRHIAVFVSASESFSQKNINCSIAESIEKYKLVINQAKSHNITIRGYISCVLGCPFEGAVDPKQTVKLAKVLYELGCYEISLGDTIGVGTAKKAAALIKAVATEIPLSKLAMHFHDTYGQALANIYAGLEVGARIIDSSVAGLGGCPYAKGATGNVATEEVLYLLNDLNLQTHIDLSKAIKAGQFMCDYLKKPNNSKVSRALSHGL